MGARALVCAGLIVWVLSVGAAGAEPAPAAEKVVEVQGDARIAEAVTWADAHYRVHGNVVLLAGGTLTVERATVELMGRYDREFRFRWQGGKLVTREAIVGGTLLNGIGCQTCFELGRGEWDATDTTVRYSFGISMNDPESVFRAVRLRRGPNPDALIITAGRASLTDGEFNVALSAYADAPGKGSLELPVGQPLNTVFDASNVPGAKYRLELANTRVPFWFLFMRAVSAQGPPVEVTLRNCPAFLPSILGHNLRGEFRLPVLGDATPPGAPLVTPNTSLTTGNVTWRVLDKPAGIRLWGVYLSGQETDVTLLGPTNVCELMIWGGKATLAGTPGTHDARSQATTIDARGSSSLALRGVALDSSKYRGQVTAGQQAQVTIEDAQVLSHLLLRTEGQGKITARGVAGRERLEVQGAPGSVTVEGP